jgi:hypothetical protein
MDTTSRECPAMDTTNGEECPHLGITSGEKRQRDLDHALQFVVPMGNGPITMNFVDLSKCFQESFPNVLLRIAILMFNISQSMNEKIHLARTGQISLDWTACCYYLITVHTTIKILTTDRKQEYTREIYLAELEQYEKYPGLKDLTGFEAIYKWERQLFVAIRDLLPLDMNKRFSLEALMREFFGMINHQIFKNRPAKSAYGPNPEHNPEPAIVLCPAIPEEVRQSNRHKYPIDGFDDDDSQECKRINY